MKQLAKKKGEAIASNRILLVILAFLCMAVLLLAVKVAFEAVAVDKTRLECPENAQNQEDCETIVVKPSLLSRARNAHEACRELGWLDLSIVDCGVKVFNLVS